ncbi:MAG: metallophosphoesterase family protein, partial [Elusimicrobiota bacterium]
REFQFIFNGKKCVVIHGHQYDRFLIKNKVISKTMNASYRALQKIDGGKRRASRFVKKQYKFWLRLSPRVIKGAVKHAIDRKAQVIICGHTHQHMDKTVKGIRYINIGSWTDSPSSFVVFGKDGIKIELFS